LECDVFLKQFSAPDECRFRAPLLLVCILIGPASFDPITLSNSVKQFGLALPFAEVTVTVDGIDTNFERIHVRIPSSTRCTYGSPRQIALTFQICFMGGTRDVDSAPGAPAPAANPRHGILTLSGIHAAKCESTISMNSAKICKHSLCRPASTPGIMLGEDLGGSPAE
jgi:hypothetical protein